VSFGAPTHELALGVTGINPWFGTCVNPADTRARARRVFERVWGSCRVLVAVALGADTGAIAKNSGLLADGLALEAAAWRSFRRAGWHVRVLTHGGTQFKLDCMCFSGTSGEGSTAVRQRVCHRSRDDRPWDSCLDLRFRSKRSAEGAGSHRRACADPPSGALHGADIQLALCAA
jgi:hypothetical protein